MKQRPVSWVLRGEWKVTAWSWEQWQGRPEGANDTRDFLIISHYIKVPLFYVCGRESWCLAVREGRKLKIFEKKELKRIFALRREEATWKWRKLLSGELHNLYWYVIKVKWMRLEGCRAHGWNSYGIFVLKSERNTHVVRYWDEDSPFGCCSV
jgi:hypothetical protein